MEICKMREMLLAKHYKLNTRLTQGRVHLSSNGSFKHVPDKTSQITKDMLITGALEQALQNMVSISLRFDFCPSLLIMFFTLL